MKRKQFEVQQAEADAFGGSILASEYWKGLRKSGFAAAVERMADVLHWETILPAMEIPGEIERAFMDKFNTRAAIVTRAKSVGGLLSVRDLREKSVARTAYNLADAMGGSLRLSADYDGSPPRIVPNGLLNTAKGELAYYLLECVMGGDWKSLEALAKLIKRRDEPEDARGGELSYEGQTWTAFCLLHWNHRTLPTKAEIRESMALGEENRGEFSKWVNRLGLGGLPEK